MVCDDGCSRHMPGDQIKFIWIREINGGKMNFETMHLLESLEKALLPLIMEEKNPPNVLYIEGLKNNILSDSHICDQGFNVISKSKWCDIQKSNSNKLVAKSIRTNNIYT